MKEREMIERKRRYVFFSFFLSAAKSSKHIFMHKSFTLLLKIIALNFECGFFLSSILISCNPRHRRVEIKYTESVSRLEVLSSHLPTLVGA